MQIAERDRAGVFVCVTASAISTRDSPFTHVCDGGWASTFRCTEHRTRYFSNTEVPSSAPGRRETGAVGAALRSDTAMTMEHRTDKRDRPPTERSGLAHSRTVGSRLTMVRLTCYGVECTSATRRRVRRQH
jgi:hypothetical protein